MTLAVRFWLPSVAVTIAPEVLELVSVPVVAENVALLCPDITVTLDGTLSAALLLFRATAVLDDADSFKETVHVEEALGPMDEGPQVNDVMATGGLSVKLTGATVVPVAVRAADWLEATCDAVAVNCAVL